ncbi:MAG: 30S ribosomal protein S6 [Phycisphaerales bacterium JB063]
MSDTDKTHLYEGLFLIDQGALASDPAGAAQHVQDMLDRAEATTRVMHKWEERKLAYPIAGQKRGTFFLAYFDARPAQIANIERDCNLSEQVLRVMMTRCDFMGEEEIARALAGEPLHKEEPAPEGAGVGADNDDDD